MSIDLYEQSRFHANKRALEMQVGGFSHFISVKHFIHNKYFADNQ